MILVTGSRGSYNSTKAIIEGTGGRIGEIYLSIANSRFGSGRNYVHEVDMAELIRQTDVASKEGIDISLAFNTVCFGMEKFKQKFLDEFIQLAEKIKKAGVKSIILSDPYLMEVVKNKITGLKVVVSVFAETDTLNRLRYYNSLGVDRIIIPHELNRNLKLLSDFAKKSSCDLEVILNLGCSHYCVRGDTHSMFTGHYTGQIRKQVFGDCYTAWCNSYKLNNPLDFLSQDWIRPEDVYRYENIGIKYFKIAGRATAASWIINTANAYINRSYEGNFFDLISTYYPFVGRLPEKKAPFYVLNKDLDSVMEDLYNCGHSCESCGSCKKIAKELMDKGKLIMNQ